MLLRSGIVVAFLTLLSRFFGLARELFIAATFGSTAIGDCVNVAFKFPNLFRRIFGEGALSAVFIPMYSDRLLESTGSAQKFSGAIFTILLIILALVSILMQVFMPYLMVIIAPGFYENSDKFNLAVLLCRITTPYLIFISITAFFGGITNSVRQFAAFAFTPIIMNIGVIIITFGLKGYYPVHISISLALIISGALQVGFMYTALIRANLTFPLLFTPRDPDVRKFLKNMGPAVIGSGAQQLNLFISQSIASFIPGAVSILSYADRLYQLPLALIGVTFGTILLPELSQLYKRRDFNKANALQNNAIKIAIALSMPAMFGLFTLSHPIIHLIFERGEFNGIDTIKTASALAAFAIGLPAFVITKVLTPIFYANLDTKTPLKITIYSIIVNTVLDISLMFPLGHTGIALGSSIAAWYNVFLLYKYAKMYGEFRITTSTLIFSAKIIVNCLIMSCLIYIIDYFYGYQFYSEKTIIKISSLLGTIGIAMLVFSAIGFCQKLHIILLRKI